MNKRQYIIDNFKSYNLINSKCEMMQDKKDMIKLLNILECNNESLDSLHKTITKNFSEFCGIFGPFENENDICRALYEHHVFFENEVELKSFIKKQIADVYPENEKITVEEYLENEEIYKTIDGYVLKLYY
jgi:hypothetical protein